MNIFFEGGPLDGVIKWMEYTPFEHHVMTAKPQPRPPVTDEPQPGMPVQALRLVFHAYQLYRYADGTLVYRWKESTE